MTPPVILRVIGAVAALVGGFAHLSLYNDGYADIPSEFGGIGPFSIGDQFLLNTVGGIAIAIGLVLPLFVRLPDLIWKLAAVGGIPGRRSLWWRPTSLSGPMVVGSISSTGPA